MGIANIDANTLFCTRLNRIWGINISQLWRFLSNTHMKCVRKNNSNMSNVSNSNFDRVY